MFGKKKDTKQDQSIPESAEEPKLTVDNESEFEKARPRFLLSQESSGGG